MDPRERELEPEETLRMAFEGMISRVWCALPGILQAVTHSGNSCEVQPAVNGRVRQLDGTYKSIQMPKLVDVPICWAGGGGATWTFPLKTGDEGLLVFSSRCIDRWWYDGFSPPTGQLGADGKPVNTANDAPEFRLHNLTDGFFIPGARSLKRGFTQFDANTARLRTDDDTTYIEFDPVNKKVNIVASGGVTINSVTIDSSGNVVSPATLTGQTEVVAKSGGNAVHLSSHTTPNIVRGGATSDPPTPGS